MANNASFDTNYSPLGQHRVDSPGPLSSPRLLNVPVLDVSGNPASKRDAAARVLLHTPDVSPRSGARSVGLERQKSLITMADEKLKKEMKTTWSPYTYFYSGIMRIFFKCCRPCIFRKVVCCEKQNQDQADSSRKCCEVKDALLMNLGSRMKTARNCARGLAVVSSGVCAALTGGVSLVAECYSRCRSSATVAPASEEQVQPDLEAQPLPSPGMRRRTPKAN